MVRLTSRQVREVMREASSADGLSALLGKTSELELVRGVLAPLLKDPKCSQTLLRGLLVLLAFPIDGSERELTEAAGEVGLSPSTMHRYVCTWTRIGLLVQDPRSRRYRRIAAAPADRATRSR